MLFCALLLLIVGLVASVLGIAGVAVIASQLAWVLLVVGGVLLVIHFASGLSRPIV
jgi:uncharacterized membrane protein YtjA (UPF0391 family)